MASKAQGQFTITDFNDAVSLTSYISSNHPKTQMYNPDNGTYTPNWATQNMVLTPSLFVTGGGSTDKITSADVTSVKWFDGTSTTAITSTGSYALSGTKSHILTIKGNVLAGLAGKDYRCEITYKDPASGLSVPCVTSITLSRVVNGGGIVDLIVTTPNGNIFKNASASATLTAKAELWRGSTVDTTNVSYQWYAQDTSVTTDEGGGIGWKKLTNAAGTYGGATTDTLTIYAATVDSFAVVKCIAKDTDSASATYNGTFTDTASFIDTSDPITVVINSTGGSVFKNGTGSTTLKAVVYQNGVEIDAEGKGTYTWSKYNNSGTLETTWGTSGHKTGKSITVGGADVDTKATFVCEVTI